MKKFITEGNIYAAMLIFIIIFSSILFVSDFSSPERRSLERAAQIEEHLEMLQIGEQLKDKLSSDESLEKLYREKKPLAIILTLGSLIGSLFLVIGFILSIIFVVLKLRNKELLRPVRTLEPVSWGPLDIFKLTILFLFASHSINILETVFRQTGILAKTVSRNLLIVFNTSLLDILVFSFVVYFVVIKYRQSWISLGLSMKNWLKGIFLGFAGYIAILPALLLILLLVTKISDYFGYQPPVHPLMKIFFAEDNPLIITGVVVLGALVAPLIEEIVFRGFIYGAIKKKIGVASAIVVTSVFFSLLHMNIFSFLPIFFLGIVLAYLYEKTGSLISSITLHVIHNSLLISVILLMKGIIG